MDLTDTRTTRPDSHVRTIRSFARRGTRLNAAQQRAWEVHAGRFVLSAAAQMTDGFRITDAFSRQAPMAVEIGFGVGEALVPLATGRPAWNVVGFEVWQPGVADCLAALGDHVIDNVRLSTMDATWALEHVFGPATIEELWTFFPDPWQKARHHKRRLVNAGFAQLVASRLTADGVWRLATDWPHYAEQMAEVLDAEPLLTGGVTHRYAERPLTRFERRGIAAGREITDLAYRRVGPAERRG
ncbi:MAG TPA: tRNA (guanosine(46)-N7)-methyltransferase TrmB [Mycobacteriales bacterium]|nr:tRNA (guanosine(46)-N7)-methyltransferase TrmB [Mycobacteriales bacterium]